MVYDVLGELFEGHALRDLLVDAIRYGDRPEKKAELFRNLEDARRNSREAQQGDQRSPRRSQAQGADCRPGPHSGSRLACRLRQAHRR
jgi:hypothetical protein